MRRRSHVAIVAVPCTATFMPPSINTAMTHRERGLPAALSVIRGGPFLFIAEPSGR